MKKTSLKVAVVLLSGALLCSSCIGSFGLFNKYELFAGTQREYKAEKGRPFSRETTAPLGRGAAHEKKEFKEHKPKREFKKR